ncbi:hypothetical protein BX600DRAFT_249081 [Xylariales sp. PMI_506]|nr:hypothetical protein BX600DRAFT_249081 [Xylariales sp. PMI_506]
MAPFIAIVGAGPGGLMLGCILERKGIDYIIYERDESEAGARGGGSLDIHRGGQSALQEAGLMDQFQEHARWEDDVFKLYGKDGKRVWQFEGGPDAEPSEGEAKSGGHPEIDRLSLRQVLLSGIPKDKIRWGAILKAAVMRENGEAVLEFTDGSSASGFDLVVGADGAWSRIRHLLTPATPEYSGQHYIEIWIHPGHPLYESVSEKYGHGMAALLGDCKGFLIMRQGDRSYRVYLSALVPEDFTRTTVNLSDVEAARRIFLSTDFYAGWAEDLKDIIRSADCFRSWPLYSLPADSQGWSPVPGVTAIGDAAHLALPNGEGVNIALTDAVELASKIAACGDGGMDRAVQEYEEAMFARGKDSIAAGHFIKENMFHPDGPAAFLRASQSHFES